MAKEEIETEEARAGRTKTGMRYVLGLSTVAAFIALLIVYALFF